MLILEKWKLEGAAHFGAADLLRVRFAREAVAAVMKNSWRWQGKGLFTRL
jgi:hypothetical protein